GGESRGSVSRTPRAGGGEPLGSGPLPQPTHDRLRRAGGRPDPGRARADVRRRDCDAARPRRRHPPAARPPRLMPARLHPWSESFMQLALAELVILGVVGAVVGCWILSYELAY